MDMTNMPLPQTGAANVLPVSGTQTKELKNSASNSSKDGKNGSGKNFNDLFTEASSGNVGEKKETDANASGDILAGLNAAYTIVGNLSQQVVAPELAQMEIEQGLTPSKTEAVGGEFSENLAQIFEMAASNEANVESDESSLIMRMEPVISEAMKATVSMLPQGNFFVPSAMEAITLNNPKANTAMEEPKSALTLTNQETLKQPSDLLQNELLATKDRQPIEIMQPDLIAMAAKETAVQSQKLSANAMPFNTQTLPSPKQGNVLQQTNVSTVNPLGEVIADTKVAEPPQVNSLLQQLNAKTLRNVEKNDDAAQQMTEGEGQKAEAIKPLVIQTGRLDVSDQSGQQEGSQNMKQGVPEKLLVKAEQTIEPIEVEVKESVEPLPMGTTAEIKSSVQTVSKQEAFNLSDTAQNTVSASVLTGIAQTRGETTNAPTVRPDLHAAMEQAAKYDVPGQIVEQARLIKSGEDAQMVIKLKPDHLGDLTLKVTVENGAVNATFHSDNAQVRSMLEATLVQFKQDMANQGIKVDNVGVYAGLGQSLPDDRGEAGRQQQGSKYKNRKIAATAFDEEGEKASVPLNSNASADGVDYRI